MGAGLGEREQFAILAPYAVVGFDESRSISCSFHKYIVVEGALCRSMADFELPSDTVVMDVESGVCRFTARVTAYMEGEQVRVSVESDCPQVRNFGDRVKVLGRFEALKMPFSENTVFLRGGETLRHSSCPIPTAVCKCAETAAGFALQKDVSLKFVKK